MLCWIFFFLSLISGALHYFLQWLPSFCNESVILEIAFALLIFVGNFIAFNILFWIVIIVWTILLPNKPGKKPSKSAYGMIFCAMDWLMSFSRVHIQFVGKELLPKEKFVLVSNHISDFDPMVWLSKIWKRRILFISKESNFKIPIVGKFIRYAGFLSIDREDPMKAMRTIKNATDTMTKFDLSFGVYPEGTRSRDGRIQPFKEGAFLLAKKANAPLVVAALQNTEKIKKNAPWKRTNVIITILRVYSPEETAKVKMSELALETHDIILKQLGDSAKPLE